MSFLETMGLAFAHADIHRQNVEGSCCCPGHDVMCEGCPTHKQAYRTELEEATRLLAKYAGKKGGYPAEVAGWLEAHP